jgi:hypothetical protein
MPIGASELVQRVRQVQALLESVLGVERLPRARDRVQTYAWGTVPLTYEGPRFGVVETSVAEHPLRGWQVTLAEALQVEPGHVVAWVLWREAFLGLLLPHVRQIPEVADLGLYAGLQYGEFSEEQKQGLKALWERVSPPQHHVHYIYNAPYGFPLFDGVVDGAFLVRVITWLNGFRASIVAPLTSVSYTAALEQWMLETHVPLTANEVRILSVLARTTQFKQTEIARHLDMLPSALSPALAKLAQRHILRLYNFIDLPLIGLNPIELFLRVRDSKTRSKWMELLSNMPYAYSLTTMQQDWFVVRFLVPHDHMNTFQKWVETLSVSQELASVDQFTTSEIIDHWNFTSYTPGVGWIEDFSVIMEQVRSSLKTQQARNFENGISRYLYSQGSNQKPIALCSEDFIYFRRLIDIVFVTDRISPKISQEIRNAGLSESAYRRRVQILEENNISKLGRLWLLHIGLDTVIHFLVFESQEITTNFIRALQSFPYLSGSVFETNSGRFSLMVPNSQAVEVLSFLRKLSTEFKLNLLVEAKPYWKAATGLQFPIKEDNYNFVNKTWKWDDSSVPMA